MNKLAEELGFNFKRHTPECVFGQKLHISLKINHYCVDFLKTIWDDLKLFDPGYALSKHATL